MFILSRVQVKSTFKYMQKQLFTESGIDDDQKSSKSMLSSKSKISTIAFIKKSASPSPKKQQKQIEDNQIINQQELVQLREDELDPELLSKKQQIEEQEEKRRQERDQKQKNILEEQERIQKKKNEEEYKRKTYEETKKSLRNREFTYDYNGKIVLVRGPKPENLPQDAIAPLPEVNVDNPVIVDKIAYEKIGIKIPEYRKLEPTIASETSSNTIEKKSQKKQSRPQTAGKARIVITKNSQNQQKRPQSGTEITQEKRISTASTNNQISIEQNEEKLQKQQSQQSQQQKRRIKKNEFGEAFLPKHPPIYDLLNPSNGVGIKFSNGVRKTGGEISILNRMKKADYDKMLENQPKQSYLQEGQQYVEGETKTLKENIKIKEIQEHMDELKKSQNALSLKNKLSVRIVEEDQYVKMLQTQICGSYPKQIIQQKLSQSRVSSTRKPGKVQKFERITAYSKQNILTELPLLNVQQKLKPTKAQQFMEKFNENEIFKNPNWGDKNIGEQQSSVTSKEGFYNNAVNFRQKRELCTTQQRPVSSKFRSSSLGQATGRPQSAVKYQYMKEQKESLITSKLNQMKE